MSSSSDGQPAALEASYRGLLALGGFDVGQRLGQPERRRCGRRWPAAWGVARISPHAVPALVSEELRHEPGLLSAGLKAGSLRSTLAAGQQTRTAERLQDRWATPNLRDTAPGPGMTRQVRAYLAIGFADTPAGFPVDAIRARNEARIAKLKPRAGLPRCALEDGSGTAKRELAKAGRTMKFCGGRRRASLQPIKQSDGTALLPAGATRRGFLSTE
jgi:hypothetical protein